MRHYFRLVLIISIVLNYSTIHSQPIDKIYFQQLLENKSVVFDQNDMNISELGLNVHIHDYIPLTSCVLFVLLLTSILVLLKGSNYLQEASKLKEYNSNVFRIAIGAPINNHQLTFFKILLYTWLFLPSLMYVSTVLINNYYEIFFTEKHYLFHPPYSLYLCL